MIGAEPEFPAWLELGGDQVKRPRIHHPALGMPGLGPGIGMEQIDEAERGIGQPLEHVQGVAHVEPDVGEMAVADMAEGADDSVEERLAADEAVIGQEVGAKSEMLAGAEADLQVKRPAIAEQCQAVDRPLFWNAQRRQQLVDQLRLPGPKLVPGPAAVKALQGRRIAHGAPIASMPGPAWSYPARRRTDFRSPA